MNKLVQLIPTFFPSVTFHSDKVAVFNNMEFLRTKFSQNVGNTGQKLKERKKEAMFL